MCAEGNGNIKNSSSFLRLVEGGKLNQEKINEGDEEKGPGLYEDSTIKEKSMTGNTEAILKLVQTDDLVGELAEGVRLCLFRSSRKACSIFGAQNADKMTPVQYDLLYGKIHTEDRFDELSDRIRNDASSIFEIVNSR